MAKVRPCALLCWAGMLRSTRKIRPPTPPHPTHPVIWPWRTALHASRRVTTQTEARGRLYVVAAAAFCSTNTSDSLTSRDAAEWGGGGGQEVVVEADGFKDTATWPRSREVSIVSRFECASSILFNRKATHLLSTPPPCRPCIGSEASDTGGD